MMSKDRRKFPSTSFPIVLHENCCSAIIELNLAISLRKMIGVRNLISWIMNNLLLTIIIPRGTMYVDSPLAKFTKSDGILSLMHCQEWNSVSFIRMDFSELSSTWNVLVGKLTVRIPTVKLKIRENYGKGRVPNFCYIQEVEKAFFTFFSWLRTC